MPLLDTLERKFGRFTFPYLLELLLIGQVMVYFATESGLVPVWDLMLVGAAVMSGQVWRIFTFMVIPLRANPLFFALFIYITWLIGDALRNQWSEFRFSLFVGMGWACTVAASLLFPLAPMENAYILGTFMIAFAALFPNFEILLFFVLPIKVKYLGWLWSAGYVLALIGGPWEERAQVIAAAVPLAVFFGPRLLGLAKTKKRATRFKREAARPAGEPFHVCSRCGRTDRSDPDLAFRYAGDTCICEDCLQKERPS